MIYKLLTIFLISASAYVFGPITKYVRTFDNKLQDINVVEKTNLQKKIRHVLYFVQVVVRVCRLTYIVICLII